MPEDWTEKYRPKTLSDIVGNENAIRVMRRWASSWKDRPPSKRSIVLRGEPGIGKTSAALALANDYGWDTIEMNASDHRNAESIRRVAGLGSVSQTFSATGEFLSTNEGRRKLIILDEADNLFGREDYGGAKAIVETIRETNQPIILIVNDYYGLTRKASAVKTLAEKAAFSRLPERSIAGVLERICQAEGVTVDAEVLRAIAKNSGGDLRGAVNDLQMAVQGRRTVDALDDGLLGKRNQEVELGVALRDMFAMTAARDARNAMMSVDKTPEDLILWIDESIPQEFNSSEELASAFDALSRSDVFLARTRRLQHYGLWAYARELMTGGVAIARGKGRRRVPYRYGFPGYLIMMSRSRSIRSTRSSLAAKLSPFFHTSGREVMASVVPYLSVMVRNDPDLLASVGADAGLDEGDVAYLLGVEAGSAKVKDAMSRIAVARGEEPGAPRSTKGAKPSRKKARNLADF